MVSRILIVLIRVFPRLGLVIKVWRRHWRVSLPQHKLTTADFCWRGRSERLSSAAASSAHAAVTVPALGASDAQVTVMRAEAGVP